MTNNQEKTQKTEADPQMIQPGVSTGKTDKIIFKNRDFLQRIKTHKNNRHYGTAKCLKLRIQWMCLKAYWTQRKILLVN